MLSACNIMYVILKGRGLGLVRGKAWRLGRMRNGRSGLNLRGWSGREVCCPRKSAGVAVCGAEALGLPLGGSETWSSGGLDSQSFQGLL